ncbi:jg6379 [Pararge aegeria aegeria]|uniref:Jg6379 protein n=1 Tax=Pararge aegeria aegeria TaxID=348720 RepID=A0A8S4RUT7_9NEOP|nr:jg6379 [Pararge aegeria aegeria]
MATVLPNRLPSTILDCIITYQQVRLQSANLLKEKLPRMYIQIRSLLWDATCVDTLAASHIQATSSMVGAAATSAEQAKKRKYENLDSSFIFVPFGVETLGPCGPEARALFKELSKKVIGSTGDPRAGSYFGQRISLAIQRGNAASILGTVPRCGGFEDVLDFI